MQLMCQAAIAWLPDPKPRTFVPLQTLVPWLMAGFVCVQATNHPQTADT